MDPGSIGLRLHHISSHMPFGHTSYVPDEETRNLCTNFPEPDILQPSYDIRWDPKTSKESFEIPDSLVFDRERAQEYCFTLSSSTLSHPNYRKLAWQTLQGEYEDSLDSSRRLKITKAVSPPSGYTNGPKESPYFNLSTNRLENSYRLAASIPFCIQPDAAYLMQQASITQQRKSVSNRLGTDVFYLNDRKYMKSMKSHLEERLNRESDKTQQRHALMEKIKNRKITSINVDELTDTEQIKQEKNKSRKRSFMQINEKNKDDTLLNISVISKEGKSDVGNTDSVDAKSSEKNPRETPVSVIKSFESGTPDELGLSIVESKIQLTTKLSMKSLYNEAEEMVKPLGSFTKRTLKYKNLSWER